MKLLVKILLLSFISVSIYAESIPYSPSLAIANIVPQKTLDILKKISAEEHKISAAEEDLNMAILTLRSLEMTINEMVNMKIAISEDLKKAQQTAKENIQKAATELVKARIGGYGVINGLKKQLRTVTESYESPVDYNRTQIKKMPLSADSLKMNAQYFHFDKNSQKANNTISNMKAYVSAEFSWMGDGISSNMSKSVQKQVSKQLEHHDIQGTLIITASCTHKQAVVLAPFIIDVDKAIRVWNRMYPNDMIKTNSPASMAQIAKQQQTKKEKYLPILSGATYGSSFVGMVHILKSSKTKTSQKMRSSSKSIQEQIKYSSWFWSLQGGIGMDRSSSKDIKNMLSTQQVTSHITVISMGLIPSIKSNLMKMSVKEFADFDPSKMMEKLATLANATSGSHDSVNQTASKARMGQTMMSMQNQKIQSVMTGIKETDAENNKVLDTNSLMTAFEDYVNKAMAGNIGVPVTYYIKPITRSQLAQMWIAKYYPGMYNTSSGDDSKPDNTKKP